VTEAKKVIPTEKFSSEISETERNEILEKSKEGYADIGAVAKVFRLRKATLLEWSRDNLIPTISNGKSRYRLSEVIKLLVAKHPQLIFKQKAQSLIDLLPSEDVDYDKPLHPDHERQVIMLATIYGEAVFFGGVNYDSRILAEEERIWEMLKQGIFAGSMVTGGRELPFKPEEERTNKGLIATQGRRTPAVHTKEKKGLVARKATALRWMKHKRNACKKGISL
jgi:hypothetical protein